MVQADDIKYMERALELAALPGGKTRPNPLVGSVIVHQNRIIGEGFHTEAGKPHAEVNAVSSVNDKSLLKESTIYITLEPCSHHGKTPPCVSMVVNMGFPRVVIGTIDTSSKVSGNGAKILKATGCEVITGVLENECREINKRFFCFHEKKRPYIVLKWAKSQDSFIDRKRSSLSDKGPNWITGIEEKIAVHKWRSEEHSILIGDKTACNDNPGLDVRYWEGINPLRIILSEKAILPPSLKLLTDGMRTIIYTLNPGTPGSAHEYVRINDKKSAIKEVLEDLYHRNIQSVLVEGGATVLNQFINNRLWDEARVFQGNMMFGAGLKSPAITGRIIEEKYYENTNLLVYRSIPVPGQ